MSANLRKHARAPSHRGTETRRSCVCQNARARTVPQKKPVCCPHRRCLWTARPRWARRTHERPLDLRVRFHIIRNARIENVGKSQSCMVSKLRLIWKQTVWVPGLPAVAESCLPQMSALYPKLACVLQPGNASNCTAQLNCSYAAAQGATNGYQQPGPDVKPLLSEKLLATVRFQIIRHARTHSVGKYQSCMF